MNFSSSATALFKICYMMPHIPVLLREATEAMDVQPGNTVLDATLGLGGHCREWVRQLQRGVLVGIDADQMALTEAQKNLAPLPPDIITHFVQDNFRNIVDISSKIGIDKYDRIFCDLGWGTHQMTGGRGFSFMYDEPLNMCYSAEENLCEYTALDVVNSFSKEKLADCIYEYGEERFARRIAENIVRERSIKPIVTTKHLASVIARAVPKRFRPKHLHPATKTFQAIRITVNDEINALRDFLEGIPTLTSKKSRITILSFHSLEDRVVKQTFRGWEKDALGKRYKKKAIQASREEVQNNSRSRSAKLRTFIFS